MRRSVFLILYAFVGFTALAQVNTRDLYKECKDLDTNFLEERLEARIRVSSEAKRIGYYLKARDNYKAYPVIHTRLDWDHYMATGELIFHVEKSAFPFDIFYLDNKYKFRLSVETSRGKVKEIQNNHYASFASGYCQRFERAIKKVAKTNPEFILKCHQSWTLFMTIKDEELLAYDVNDEACMLVTKYFNKYKDVIQEEIDGWRRLLKEHNATGVYFEILD